jgi:hypothetical protein
VPSAVLNVLDVVKELLPSGWRRSIELKNHLLLAGLRCLWNRGDGKHDCKRRQRENRFLRFVDIPILAAQQAPIRFAFFWTASDHGERRDFKVSIF